MLPPALTPAWRCYGSCSGEVCGIEYEDKRGSGDTRRVVVQEIVDGAFNSLKWGGWQRRILATGLALLSPYSMGVRYGPLVGSQSSYSLPA